MPPAQVIYYEAEKVEYKDPGRITFEAVIQAEPESSGTYIEFPYDVMELYGTKGRVPVMATFDGVPYRGSMANMGMGRHILIIVKDIRQKIGKQPGDRVNVTIDLDAQKRSAEVPEDFRALLGKNSRAGKAFEKLSYSHRREYVGWIESAIRAQTRQRRLNRAIEMLGGGDIKNRPPA